MTDKLKPCPFCGGKAFMMGYLQEEEFFIKKEYKYSVMCRKCHAETRGSLIEAEAIEAWNTRKPMDKVVEQLEKLKKYEADSACPKDGMCDEVGRTCTVCYTTSAIEIVKKGGEQCSSE